MVPFVACVKQCHYVVNLESKGRNLENQVLKHHQYHLEVAYSDCCKYEAIVLLAFVACCHNEGTLSIYEFSDRNPLIVHED